MDPGIADDERPGISEMVSGGGHARITLTSADFDGTFPPLKAAGPMSARERQSSSTVFLDCAFRDPVGNLVRID